MDLLLLEYIPQNLLLKKNMKTSLQQYKNMPFFILLSKTMITKPGELSTIDTGQQNILSTKMDLSDTLISEKENTKKQKK